MEKNKDMNAIEIDRWIRRLRTSGFGCVKMDEESRQLLLRLFDVTAQIEAMGDDDRKQLWLKVSSGSLEEYCAYFDSEDYTKEELEEDYHYSYPDPEKWYSFVSVHHGDTRDKEEFYGVFLGGEYILSLNDPNEAGNYPVDASELIQWMIDEISMLIDEMREDRYNSRISRDLPAIYRTGSISRKEYWDIYPELREECHAAFENDEINRFLSFWHNGADEKPVEEDCIEHMTARQFYEACAICYHSVGYNRGDPWKFKDSDEEHQRYGGITPKELFYLIADGRDDGLMNVPIDSAEDFYDWLHEKGPYYEFNGHHPWEIRPSGSLRYSIHLYVSKTEAHRFYYSLSGDMYSTSFETVRYYLAIKKAGLPVYLYDMKRIAERYEEKDRILILPETQNAAFSYGHYLEGQEVDAVNLSDGDKPEKVIKKANWFPEKQANVSNLTGL